jgi:hypothetical protein
VYRWFVNRESETGLRVCRIKNKFSFKKEDVVGGYRDLMFCVIYRCLRTTCWRESGVDLVIRGTL